MNDVLWRETFEIWGHAPFIVIINYSTCLIGVKCCQVTIKHLFMIFTKYIIDVLDRTLEKQESWLRSTYNSISWAGYDIDHWIKAGHRALEIVFVLRYCDYDEALIVCDVISSNILQYTDSEKCTAANHGLSVGYVICAHCHIANMHVHAGTLNVSVFRFTI